MAEEVIEKDRIDYTIDLLITMAVEEIAEEDIKKDLSGRYRTNH